MPADDRVRLHEDQRVLPVLERASHQDPEHPIAVVDLRSRHRSLQHGELMSQCEVLGDESLAVGDKQSNERDQIPELTDRSIMPAWGIAVCGNCRYGRSRSPEAGSGGPC